MEMSDDAHSDFQRDTTVCLLLFFPSGLLLFYSRFYSMARQRRAICAPVNLLALKRRCHARREFFCCKIAISSRFQVYPGKINNKLVELLFDHFYPVISCRRVQEESDELLYIRFGHSLRSAISCQRKRSTSHARRKCFFFLPQNCNILSVSSTF